MHSGGLCKPSFSAVVGNVDVDVSKYVAESRAQEARREIIVDMEDMVFVSLRKWVSSAWQVKSRNPFHSFFLVHAEYHREV